MKLLIFHNRSAGTGDTSAEELVDAFVEAGFDVRYTTKKPGPVAVESLRAVDVVVIAGGDGTVTKALNDFRDFGGRFGIVPLGGANNIATSLGVPRSIREVAQGLRRGRVQPFTLGIVESTGMRHTFIEGVGCGALAESLAAAQHLGSTREEKIRIGREALAAILETARPLRSGVVVDGAPLPADILFAEVLNLPVSGPSLCLAPSANAEDDMLDVAFLPAERRDGFREALLFGHPLPVEVVRGRRIEIAWFGDRLRIDDDMPQPPSVERPLRIALSDFRVEVLVPAVAEEVLKETGTI